MSDTLKAQIQSHIISCMKEKRQAELTTLRCLMAEIKQFEIDQNNRVPLDDTQVLSVIQKMIKQRRQAIELFLQENRQDLVDKDTLEITTLQQYLPAPLSEAEINTLIHAAITQVQATGPADMGKVVTALKPQVQGRADMGQMSQQVKAALLAIAGK